MLKQSGLQVPWSLSSSALCHKTHTRNKTKTWKQAESLDCLSIAASWNSVPGDIECLLNFCLYRPKQISTHFFQQLCQQYEQPVLQIFFMDLDEVHKRLQKHTEHLKGRRRWKEGRMGQKWKQHWHMLNLQTKKKAVRDSEAEKGSVLQPSRKKNHQNKRGKKKKSVLLFHCILIQKYIEMLAHFCRSLIIRYSMQFHQEKKCLLWWLAQPQFSQ